MSDSRPSDTAPIPRKTVALVVAALFALGVVLWLFVVSTETPVYPGAPVDTSGNGMLAVWIIGGTVVIGFFVVAFVAALAARIVTRRRTRRQRPTG